MKKETEEKTYRELERMVRGFANHRRIQIMEILKKKPEMSVDEIATFLDISYKTVADHVRRLAIAGLVLKRNQDVSVRHRLTDRAEFILKFLRAVR
ncbi:MAG: MarR family transcriptional regulator [Parcubacteria group bacterium GW2011_GWA2_49_9]|nr:MAG: MarR family transcriptional regulator [Parcubacteria group bacterium GW2011_GWA2_49_9]